MTQHIPEDILRAAEAAFHAAWDAGHAGPVALALFAERQKPGLRQNPGSMCGLECDPHKSRGAPQITGSVSVPVNSRGPRKSVPAGLVIYCDGACEPNPGVGGWGFVVYRDGVEVHAEHGGERRTTNNVMEMTGALRALEWIAANHVNFSDENRGGIRLLCDSQYVVKGCNEWRHGWKRNGWNKRSKTSPKRADGEIKNLDLWKELDAVLTAMPITLEWVKGHAGIVGNERADELSLMGRETALVPTTPTAQDLIRQQLDYSARGGM